METAIRDRENLVMKPKKTTASMAPTRPALGELVGNKLLSKPSNQIIKKTSTNITKEKKTAIITIPSVLSKAKIIQKTTKHTKEEISYSTKQIISVVDPDIADTKNPLLVTEYVKDIYSYLHSLESEYVIEKDYLKNHKSTSSMRAVLVNWMIDVQLNFKLMTETLHMSIAILDRYLQLNKKVGREILQLVGATALLIASKYEETFSPEIKDFLYICDDTFDRDQFLKMEHDILCKLKFNLGRPLSLHFLRRYSKIAHVNSEYHNLAKYLLEIFLLEYRLCHFSPSMQAAAACCLSMSILKDVSDPSKMWTQTLIHYSTYTYSDIKTAMINLAHFFLKMETSSQQALKKKYASSTFGKISCHPKLRCFLIKKLAAQAELLKK